MTLEVTIPPRAEWWNRQAALCAVILITVLLMRITLTIRLVPPPSSSTSDSSSAASVVSPPIGSTLRISLAVEEAGRVALHFYPAELALLTPSSDFRFGLTRSISAAIAPDDP